MTLTNPSDAELEAVFAEKVAGWVREPDGDGGALWNVGTDCLVMGAGVVCRLPRFTRSMDAVLPWLEKWRTASDASRVVEVNQAINCNRHWHVALREDGEEGADYFWGDASLPRACVIALLRAHGVEVVFK